MLRIARWLRHTYPAGLPGPQAASARWWGSLQPDLLAERHVVTELADSPAFAAACLRDLTAVQATGALTVLARACAHRPQAPTLIAAALRADLPGLGVPAVNVAVQTSGPVGPILADVAGSCDATLEALVRIEEAIPYPTTALARADMVLTARINSMLPAGTSKADLARWRDSLGVMFSELGRPADALPATQEAVTIRRELAAANPDRYRPDLAGSLSNLGVRFSELGRPADAEAARPRKPSRSAASWPPPTPTATGPTSPARCPTSASGSRSWAARPTQKPRERRLWPSRPRATKNELGNPQPAKQEAGKKHDQPPTPALEELLQVVPSFRFFSLVHDGHRLMIRQALSGGACRAARTARLRGRR